MKIAVGADERLHVVDVALDYLKEKGHQVIWHGPETGKTHPLACSGPARRAGRSVC